MKHRRYFSPFFLLTINIILLACSQSAPLAPATEENTASLIQATPSLEEATTLPTATAVSPITSATTPTPSSTLFKQPQIQKVSETISLFIIDPAPDPLSAWSPDGQWLSFWTLGKGNEKWKSTNAGNKAKRINFINVATGTWCEMSAIALSERFPAGVWLDNNNFFITSEIAQRTVQLEPCSESSISLEPYTPFEAIAPQTATDESQNLSPDKAFSVMTTFSEPLSESTFSGSVATTTFTDIETSDSFEVSYQPNIADGLGGQWLSERLFLVNTSAEHGPLLVDVLEEKATPILNYGLALIQPTEAEYVMFTARPLPHFGSEYLILSTADQTWLFSIDQLAIFPLPFNGIAGFLPQTDSVPYLVLQDHKDAVPDRWDLYAHPFATGEDPQTWDWLPFDKMVNSWQWSNSGDAIVLTAKETIRWRRFPSGDLIGEASIAGYTMEVLTWSPDARSVLLRGTNAQNEQLIAILTAIFN